MSNNSEDPSPNSEPLKDQQSVEEQRRQQRYQSIKEQVRKQRGQERYEEEKNAVENQIEDIMNQVSEILTDEYAYLSDEEQTQLKQKDAQRREQQIKELRDIAKSAETSQKQKLDARLREGSLRLRRFMEKRESLSAKKQALKNLRRKLAQRVNKSDFLSSSQYAWEKFDLFQEKIGEIDEELHKLFREHPDNFVANERLRLREYKKQLNETGIVETPYVKEKLADVKKELRRKGTVALVGETGTGKTKVAEKLAWEMTDKSPVWVFRHAKIGKEDPLASAAQEGRMAIINMTTIVNEPNYIPPNFLSWVKKLVEAGPGEEVELTDKGTVKVKEGFGIIYTGNVTKAEFDRYQDLEDLDQDLEDLDPDFTSQLNSGSAVYNKLPQNVEDSFQKIIPGKGKENVDVDKDIFLIGLTNLIDVKGNLTIPEGALADVWNLSRTFAVLQKIYAGGEIDEENDPYSEVGADYSLEKYDTPLRTFGDILKDWKQDAFDKELEWYIYDGLLRPTYLVSPEETAQTFALLSRAKEKR